MSLIRYMRRGIRLGTWPILQRYWVANLIFNLPPARGIPKNADHTVHVPICERDAVMAHWMLRSLYAVTEQPFAVRFHDDGTLTNATIRTLVEKFPGSICISRKQAEALICPVISSHKMLTYWWPRTHKLIKWLDVYLLERSEFACLLDTDMLFFSEPKELFLSNEEAVWMRDSSYTLKFLPEKGPELFGGNNLQQLNSGLGKIRRSLFSLDKAEVLLSILKRPTDDQTFNAVLSAQTNSMRLLGEQYDCATQLGLEGRIVKHYTTPYRFWFFEEGVPRAAKLLGIKTRRWLSERV